MLAAFFPADSLPGEKWLEQAFIKPVAISNH